MVLEKYAVSYGTITFVGDTEVHGAGRARLDRSEEGSRSDASCTESR